MSFVPSGLTLAAQTAAVSHHVPTLVHAIWLIPALPMLALVLLIAFGRRLGEPAAGWLAVAGMVGAFVASVCTWFGLRSLHGEQRSYVQQGFTWLSAGSFHVDIAFLADPLSITMALFVTFVGSFIFLYSIGYMHGDADYSKFFIYLSFFAMSMLVLVTGSSLLVTFLGWEGVGAASYFLIGFWFQDIKNSSAGTKAFITNRVGDWGFMTAMFFTFFAFGTLNYDQIFANMHTVPQSTITAIVVLLFFGACGKSAQLPLYLWLPDAMAGPTPVSALMHAATMVTAGVYVLVRINPLIHIASPWSSTLIAWVGVITALFAATVALAQRDIKKVLAYSTVSQLGYMVLAVGCGAYSAAMFHMITHAFFKALLFLGAGSVITGMRNEQDMNWYGKLRKFFPITSATFIIASLSIAGVPPFAGFWSKGDILSFAWHKSPALWAVGLFTAMLTAYYMTREVYLTFFGKRRWTEETAEQRAAHHGHPTEDANGNPLPEGPGSPHHVDHGAPVTPTESPWPMTVPLIVLAIGATVLGILNLPFSWGPLHGHILEHWLEPSIGIGQSTWEVPHSLEWGLELTSILLVVIAIGIGYFIYQRLTRDEQRKFEPELLEKAWYYDLGVTAFMGGPGRQFYDFCTYVIDKMLIDGVINGTGRLVRLSGSKLRHVQTGYLRNYVLGFAAGTACLLAFVFYRATF